MRPSARGFAAFAAAAVIVFGLLAGCVSTPRAVLNVPGSYTADLWDPVAGGSSASVAMCLDEVSAVHLSEPSTGPGIGSIKLEWSGVEYSAIDGGNPVTLTTPVLQPGCGLLTFGVDCCHVDHYLTIIATKV